MQEKIVEIKACKHCSAEFHITDEDMEFYEKVSPVFSCRDTINRVSTDGNQIFNWSTYEAPFPKVDKIIPANKLPDNIKDIPDDILNRAIMPDDEIVGTGLKPVPTDEKHNDKNGTQIKKPFRIIPQELEFYRKHNIPIPHKHPDVRHEERMALRNPRKLFDRKCDKCGKDMKTTYSPDRKEIVYCEECYERGLLDFIF